MQRIFSNILNNALKYSNGDLSINLDSGGTITFSNSAKEMGGKIQAHCAGGRLRIVLLFPR